MRLVDRASAAWRWVRASAAGRWARAHAPRIAAAFALAALAASAAATAALATLPHVTQLCASARVAVAVFASIVLAAQAAAAAALGVPALLRNEWPVRRAKAPPEEAGYAVLPSGASSDVGPDGVVTDGGSTATDGDHPQRAAVTDGAASQPPTGQPPRPPPARWLRCARWAAASLLCLGVLALWSAAAAAAWLVANTVSPRVGAWAVPGLASPARVGFDGDGVAHIRVPATGASAASDEAALWFAQGFAHARARLWQMEFQRRVGAGTLAAAVGAAGLPVDRVMRTLGVRAAAERDLAALDPASPERRALDAYARGVNAFTAPAVRGGYLPLEFRVLGLAPPDPWTPADSLSWQKIMAFDLCGNLNVEAQRFGLRFGRGVDAARVDALMPSFNSTNFMTVLSMEDLDAAGPPLDASRSAPPPQGLPLPDGSLLTHLDAQLAALTAAARAAAPPPPPPPPQTPPRRGGAARSPHILRRRSFGASNNWVVNGTRSTDGLPLLANDPHLQLLAPSLWYLCHLSAPAAGIDVIGASFPGIPGVVIGRNARIAWGVTNTGVDVQDLYVMQPDAASPDASYVYDGASRAYDVRTEVIDVMGGAAELLLVRTSVHGPVVTSDALGGAIVGDDAAAARAVLSLRWSATDPTIVDTTFSAFYGLQRASNWTDFRRALALWSAPSQNVVYADIDGNIGYQMPGFVPTRNVAAGHTGAWPAPGNSSAFAWRAPWAYDALPRTFNPPRGFVASANNQVPPREWPFFLSADWDAGSDGYRAERITELLRAQPQHSPASFARIQTDYVSLFPRDVGRAVAGAAATTPGGVWLRGWLAGAGGDDAAWDHSLPVGSWQATVWADLRRRLMALGANETGGDYYGNSVFLLTALTSDGSAAGTDAACPRAGFASCAAFAGAALDATAARFAIGGSGPPAGGAGIARWGEDVHTAAITHQVLGSSLLACLADRAVAHGGEDFTVNVGGYDLDDATQTQTHGPSVRHIMALSDAAAPAGAPPASLWMQPLGQEGDILRPSYDALLARWAAGDYMAMSTADDASGDLITLSPA